MSVISKRFAAELTNDKDGKEMRDAYLAAQTSTKIAQQIRTIRQERGWSQTVFAEKLDTGQSTIVRYEDRSYGKYNLQSLLDMASEFDVGLIVEFVPYAEFLVRTSDLSPENLEVPEFTPGSLRPLCGAITREPQITNPNQAPLFEESGHTKLFPLIADNQVASAKMHDVGGKFATFVYRVLETDRQEETHNG